MPEKSVFRRLYSSAPMLDESRATRQPMTPRKFAVELVQTLLLVAVLFATVRGVLQNFRVEGSSMLPTLNSGEFLWVNKAAYFEWQGHYLLGGPQRGDI